MRILYICSKKFDYLQDLTYSGLVMLLGKEQVTDYPWNPKFNLPYKQYPKNLGYTGVSFRLFEKIDPGKYDLVILAAAKQDALNTYEKILPEIKHIPVLFLDGGDFPQIGGDFYRYQLGNRFEAVLSQRPFDIILKREYIPTEHEGMSNVFPFQFSFPYNLQVDTLLEQDKKYDVSFWGQQEPAIRANALTLLQDKYDCAQNGTTLNQDFSTYKRKGKFYLEEIARCKIVLNFRGGGWDTMRYWEVPAAGSFMISQRPQITIPNNFENGKHLVWCSDGLEDLLEIIDYYLQRPAEREAIATAAKTHLEQYHLNTCRAQALLEIVQQFMNGR